ncbi:hypothetical protein FPSE5266_02252 [Fusarium pseudograminearum]|nr:hypothetical protein FPSE5266_02252 [Fusarium pseudograminearum]
MSYNNIYSRNPLFMGPPRTLTTHPGQTQSVHTQGLGFPAQPQVQPAYYPGMAFAPPAGQFQSPPPPPPAGLYQPQVQPNYHLDFNFDLQPVDIQAGHMHAGQAQPAYSSGLAYPVQPGQAQACAPAAAPLDQPHSSSRITDGDGPPSDDAVRRMARQLQRFYESPKTLGNKDLVSEDDIKLAKSLDPRTSTYDGGRWPAHWMRVDGRESFIEELGAFRIFGSGLTVPLVDPELGQGPAPVAPADHPHNDRGVAANAIIIPDDEEMANDMLAYGQEMPDLPAEILFDEDYMPAKTFVNGVDDEMPAEDEEMADAREVAGNGEMTDDIVGSDENLAAPAPAEDFAEEVLDEQDLFLKAALLKALGRTE